MLKLTDSHTNHSLTRTKYSERGPGPSNTAAEGVRAPASPLQYALGRREGRPAPPPTERGKLLIMKYRPEVHAAFAPAQAATAMDGTTPVVLLFVPQWVEVLKAVNEKGIAGEAAETQWGFSREMQMPLFFARWSDGSEIAVTLAPGAAGEILDWWDTHRKVDVLLLIQSLPADGAPAPAGFPAPEQEDGGATWETAVPHVRLTGVPFLR